MSHTSTTMADLNTVSGAHVCSSLASLASGIVEFGFAATRKWFQKTGKRMISQRTFSLSRMIICENKQWRGVKDDSELHPRQPSTQGYLGFPHLASHYCPCRPSSAAPSVNSITTYFPTTATHLDMKMIGAFIFADNVPKFGGHNLSVLVVSSLNARQEANRAADELSLFTCRDNTVSILVKHGNIDACGVTFS